MRKIIDSEMCLYGVICSAIPSENGKWDDLSQHVKEDIADKICNELLKWDISISKGRINEKTKD